MVNEELLRRYPLCRGVPRYVFKDWFTYTIQCENFIRRMEIEDSNVNMLSDLKDQSKQLLFGIFPNEDYTHYSIDFASNAMALKVHCELKRRTEKVITRIINDPYSFPAFDCIYKPAVIDQLCMPGKHITFKPLNPLSMETATISIEYSHTYFGGPTLDDVKWSDVGQIWIPYNLNFPVIGALLVEPSLRTVFGFHTNALRRQQTHLESEIETLMKQYRDKFGAEFVLILEMARSKRTKLMYMLCCKTNTFPCSTSKTFSPHTLFHVLRHMKPTKFPTQDSAPSSEFVFKDFGDL